MNAKKISNMIKGIFLSTSVVTLISACGGGAGGAGGASSDVVVPVKGAPLSVTAASAISLQSGDSTTYKISGGGGGSKFATYTASSSNDKSLSVSINGDILNVVGKSSGSGSIVVSDGVSSPVQISFTVTAASSPLPFKANIPANLSLAVNGVGTYDIVGGVLPYKVASSNPGVINATITDSQVTLLGVSQGAGNIVVFDATGAAISVATLVGGGEKKPSALFTTAPQSIYVKPNSVNNYLIGGGVPPYIAVSSNTAISNARMIDSLLAVTGVAVGTSDVVVTDSQGAPIKITVNVATAPVKAFFTTAPQTVYITGTGSVSYSISGGTPPYSASSGNISLVQASASGNTLNLSGLASGNGTVVVFDSNGQSIPIQVIVNGGLTPISSAIPSAVTIKTNEMVTYSISGGQAPYTVVSGNTSVATAIVNGSVITITGKTAGTTSVVIRDSATSIISTSVTVAN